MTEYVLNRLNYCERNVDAVMRFCKHQNKFNGRVALLGILVVGYIYLSEKREKKQREEIKKLKKEIAGMKGD